MMLGVALGGDLWSSVAQLAVAVALAVVFHRMRDAHVLHEFARLVFPPALAVGYLVGVAGAWIANAWALFLVARSDLASDMSAPVHGPEIVAALGWFVVVVVVCSRLNRADADLHGPLAWLGRFLRVGIGTAVPAAVRSLRGLGDHREV